MLGEALKKLLLKRKKPLPLFAMSSYSGFYYLFISLFYFSIIQSPSFFLYHIIPPYSSVTLDSFPYSLLNSSIFIH